jgi:hypothetical protein
MLSVGSSLGGSFGDAVVVTVFKSIGIALDCTFFSSNRGTIAFSVFFSVQCPISGTYRLADNFSERVSDSCSVIIPNPATDPEGWVNVSAQFRPFYRSYPIFQRNLGGCFYCTEKPYQF